MASSPQEVVKEFEILNELGLHARAAAQFVKVAAQYQSEIIVEKDDREVNGKSIMGVLTLAAAKGSTIKIKATGDDATDAIAGLEDLIHKKFGEN